MNKWEKLFKQCCQVYKSSLSTLNPIKICLNNYLNKLPNPFRQVTLPNSKAKFIPIKTVLVLILLCLARTAFAQTTTTLNGPSDAVSNPPVSASAADQILPSGNTISLKIAAASTSSDVIYQWYKLDNTGTKRLVQSSSSATLSESPSGTGYYIYQLVVSNSNQCSSEISDPFKVYVLPPLSPTIAASSGTVCSNGTTTALLTANPGNDKFSYQYQWILNGNSIPGATASTYTTVANVPGGDNTYTVKVAYALSSSTTATANQIIKAVPVPNKPTVSIGQ